MDHLHLKEYIDNIIGIRIEEHLLKVVIDFNIRIDNLMKLIKDISDVVYSDQYIFKDNLIKSLSNKSYNKIELDHYKNFEYENIDIYNNKTKIESKYINKIENEFEEYNKNLDSNSISSKNNNNDIKSDFIFSDYKSTNIPNLINQNSTSANSKLNSNKQNIPIKISILDSINNTNYDYFKSNLEGYILIKTSYGIIIGQGWKLHRSICKDFYLISNEIIKLENQGVQIPAMAFSASFLYNNAIYILGGSDGYNVYSSLLKLDISNVQNGTFYCSMINPSHSSITHSIIANNDQLILMFGGKNNKTYYSDLMVIDPDDSFSSYNTGMAFQGRTHHVFTHIYKKQFILGFGQYLNQYLNDLYIVDLNQMKQTPILESVDLKRDCGLHCLVYQDLASIKKFIILGGQNIGQKIKGSFSVMNETVVHKSSEIEISDENKMYQGKMLFFDGFLYCFNDYYRDYVTELYI